MCRLIVAAGMLSVHAASDPAESPVEDPAGDVETPAAETVEATSGAASPEDVLDARKRYNAGLEDLQQGDFTGAAEAFLAARDDARGDAVLRYRSAFNLGLALAGQADASAGEAREEAIGTLRSSAAWFSDASRLAPEGDEDARVNLEIVLRRIQQLADQINRDGHLEARLDRVIDDQRGLRDQLRQLLADVESEQGADFRHRFESLAASERALLADVADIADLAAEERAHLEGKDEGTLSSGEHVRAHQLGGMDRYLQRARQSMGDTRRRFAPSGGRARASQGRHRPRRTQACPGAVGGPRHRAEGDSR